MKFYAWDNKLDFKVHSFYSSLLSQKWLIGKKIFLEARFQMRHEKYKPNAENLFNVNEFQKWKDPNSENKPVQPTEIKRQN